MIVMINGAFGIGKSIVAECLTDVLTNSMIFDPEEVGSFVRRITQNVEAPGDYQDIELWRTLTIQTAAELRKKYGRNLIIPMTIANTAYFRQIKQGLQQIDPDLYHFCLMASTQTIHKRLQKRGETVGSWPFQQTDRCQQAFQSQEFAEHLDTENSSPRKIANKMYRTLSGK
jgi:deoxyadenosine/deoxycytidine kinase